MGVTPARKWDAASYDRISGPMTQMAAAVLDRLELTGDETVLDAGCGTGRVTELLLDRLPRGRVLAVDADAEMVRLAKEQLGDRARVERVDLLAADQAGLGLDEPVDAILSTATFHWVLDHELLFRRLFDLLAPGGRLVAQCGGQGNIARLRAAADEVAGEPDVAPWFRNWGAPWYYADADVTAERLRAAGFVDVRTWLEPWPVTPEDPAQYLSTIVLGAQVQRLPVELRARFVQGVIDRLGEPVTVEYVRLNLDAVRPGRP